MYHNIFVDTTVGINLIGLVNNHAVIIPIELSGKANQKDVTDWGVGAVGIAS